MIFVDSNVPMYLVGAAHPNKERVRTLLERLIAADERFITDVEVYQEILHRYVAIGRPDALDAAMASLDAIVDDTLSFGMPEIRVAREIIASTPGISARDALHVAVMREVGATRIFSLDQGFDACEGIERVA